MVRNQNPQIGSACARPKFYFIFDKFVLIGTQLTSVAPFAANYDHNTGVLLSVIPATLLPLPPIH